MNLRKTLKSYNISPSTKFRCKNTNQIFHVEEFKRGKFILLDLDIGMYLKEVSPEDLRDKYENLDVNLFDPEDFMDQTLFLIFYDLNLDTLKARPLLVEVIWNKNLKKYLILQVYDVIESYKRGEPFVLPAFDQELEIENFIGSYFTLIFEEGIEKAYEPLERNIRL